MENDIRRLSHALLTSGYTPDEIKDVTTMVCLHTAHTEALKTAKRLLDDCLNTITRKETMPVDKFGEIEFFLLDVQKLISISEKETHLANNRPD